MPRPAVRHSLRSRYLAGCGKFNFPRIRQSYSSYIMSYTLQEHMFLARTFWVTASHRVTQTEYKKKYGLNVPDESTIHNFARKLVTTGALLDEGGKHRRQMP